MLIYLPTGRRRLNVKALVGAFNQEKAQVGAFSVITNLRIDLRFKLYSVVCRCRCRGCLTTGIIFRSVSSAQVAAVS